MASGPSPNGSVSREQKCALYRHQLFERQLKECGSFLDDHELGITLQNEKLCQQLLNGQQSTPENTLFSDDSLFKKTCRRLNGENEAKVVLRISEFISTNACWPDSAKAFDRDAFDKEQLRKLQPYLSDLLTNYSFFAATFQMYFPFLTCEVKCGDGELDAFRLAGREQELHREINGFSISHDERHVRIYKVQIYRHLISEFIFAPSGEGDQRWKAYKFVKNVYDL
ncbi:hypothetical protein GQ44DRAFT_744294 [Phaeosphaeriaceae sp. PMI808]|nr:hypothetical protein GQ44DRAFT_744294 [Phaeosphaeriaceae sp. PMI808]